jgi:hypothetical protein
MSTAALMILAGVALIAAWWWNRRQTMLRKWDEYTRICAKQHKTPNWPEFRNLDKRNRFQ